METSCRWTDSTLCFPAVFRRTRRGRRESRRGEHPKGNDPSDVLGRIRDGRHGRRRGALRDRGLLEQTLRKGRLRAVFNGD